ncbi:MAG TPA: hypothetical protein VLJ10_05215 [Candidatus Bathyarchaeia archaeon]|nr:hypothetical protein [Candidatus Bathyarchaeia archaeon]
MKIIQLLGVIAAVVMPLWNIPLIMRVIRRGSSEDISIWWALGVWVCILLMAPSGLVSADIVWRIFNIVNLIFFSGVVAVVLLYRRRGTKG